MTPKKTLFFLLLLASCQQKYNDASLSLIQIQDRNGLTETISNPDRLASYEPIDFLSQQPFQKVVRVFKTEGKNHSKLTTYHANGTPHQYLEAKEMRAHGAYREWFANGQQRIEAKVIGGTADLSIGVQEDWIFDSTCKVWDDQGNIAALIDYEKGVLEGRSQYFYSSGQIQKDLIFSKGKLEGEALEYWPNGQLKCKTAYKKGIKEGKCLGFFANGTPASIEDFNDGRVKDASYFDWGGTLVSKIEKGGGFQTLFNDKEIHLIEFRIGVPEGKIEIFTHAKELQKQFFMKNGKKQGEELHYYLPSETSVEELAPKMSITWHDGMIHGSVKTWYENGQIRSQRQYVRNTLSGPCLAWYFEGSLMLYEEYEEGKLVSGQYYKIQRKDPVSTVSSGNGTATLYDETGAFLRKVSYIKGKPYDPEE